MRGGTFELLKQLSGLCLGRGLVLSVRNEFQTKHQSPASNISYDWQERGQE